MNQAYLDVTNSTRDAIVGKPLFAAFDSGPGEEAPQNVRQVRASLEKARDTRQRDHLALVRFSIPRATPGGEPVLEERFWSATHTPILNAEGEGERARVQVSFEGEGDKWLVLGFAKLTPL